MGVSVKQSGTWKDGTPYVNDGGTWKPVQAGYVKQSGTWKQFFSAATTTYRYLRLTVANVVDGARTGFYEVRFSPDGGTTQYPPVDMTSNTVPSPLVASASQASNITIEPYRAFDGFPTSAWEATVVGNQWLQIDLGSGNEIAPNTVSYTVVNFGASSDFSPTGITVSGSNDGSTFTTLATFTGLTSQPDGTVVTKTW